MRGAEKQAGGTSGEEKKKSVPKPEGKLEKEKEQESKPQKVCPSTHESQPGMPAI